jgi:hypothetical protein
MKTIVTVLSGVTFLGLVACGPSAEQVEKQKQDSIATADSIAAIAAAADAEAMRVQDSINAATAAAEAEVKRIADSTAAAEATKAPKGKK